MNKVVDKAKAIWGKVWERLKKISKKIYIAAAAALVVLAVILVIVLNNKPYSTLVTNVSMDEMSSVLQLLEAWGVRDYKVENGDTILVLESQQSQLQARVLMENVFQSGQTKYFDNLSALSTNQERNTAILMDLEEKLRATIRSFENVQDAVVSLTPGEDRGYILDSGNVVNATAAVKVSMRDGKKLTTQQAAAIREFVSNSLQGLEISRVSITDDYGNTYSGGSLTADSDASALKMQLEEEQSNKIRTQVMQVLAPAFGEENVDVAVNCVVEVGNVTENRVDVYLPEYAQNGETNGRGIIGSLIYQWSYNRDGDETVGGVVGTESNSNIPNQDFSQYVENTPNLDGTESAADASGQIDYDNSRSEKHIVTTAGYLKDCSVAVSINSTTAGNVDTAAWQQHVARAAGIYGEVDEESGLEILDGRISVISYPFFREEPPAPVPGILDIEIAGIPLWVLIAAAGGLLLFIILLVVILLARRRRRKRLEAQEAEAQASEVDALLAAVGLGGQATDDNGADVMEIQTEQSMQLRKDIRQFASENPEIAAQMVRNWLRGGDDDG
ncbi:flagellar M-ring protein FliF C-terminal domain-containing protein [uncultured Oscillibacter sp.]|uniref:flagellar M-ring protein FliF C-terminal domain-containing protein n=1 Tax=uncultured Oscillibacter sp. TaxID=876091 RepID=UPI0025D000AB|nr:flagellar M-ring protein FliF C-terminal domain-containing protein [uncultured Oscillibacter sp.]